MFKFVLSVFLGGLLFFAGFHVLMRFGGSPDFEIRSVLIGSFVLMAGFSLFTALWHRVRFRDWVMFVILLMIPFGISYLAVEHLIWAVSLGIGCFSVLGFAVYQVYLDTPYGFLEHPVRNVPGVGFVMMEGRTPREVKKEMKEYKRQHASGARPAQSKDPS